MPNLKKVPPGVPEILHLQEWDGQMDRQTGQPKNIMPPATPTVSVDMRKENIFEKEEKCWRVDIPIGKTLYRGLAAQIHYAN